MQDRHEFRDVNYNLARQLLGRISGLFMTLTRDVRASPSCSLFAGVNERIKVGEMPALDDLSVALFGSLLFFAAIAVAVVVVRSMPEFLKSRGIYSKCGEPEVRVIWICMLIRPFGKPANTKLAAREERGVGVSVDDLVGPQDLHIS